VRGSPAARPSLSGPRIALLALLLAASFCACGTGTASAAFLHPTLSESFGINGTETNEGFGEQAARELRIDQERHRLYVLRSYLSLEFTDEGKRDAQPPRGIYGYEIGPGVHAPLGGGFPVVLAHAPQFKTRLAVDESEGRLYYIDAQDGNGPHPYGTLFGFAADGSPLGGAFPEALTTKVSSVTVDPLGFMLVVQTTSNGTGGEIVNKIWRYGPEGDILDSVDITPFFVGNSGGGAVIDKYTGDLWVYGYLGETRGMYRFSAASGYSEPELAFSPDWAIRENLGESQWTFDARDGIFYGTAGNVVHAYNESGALVESFAKSSSKDFSPYWGMAVDESTGTLYVLEEGALPGGLLAGADIHVYPGVTVPDVTTGPPTASGHTTATVTGHVDPAEGPGITECEFQYGTNKSYGGGSVPCTPTANPGSPITTGTDVTAELTGLTAGTEYHYRLVASNSNGQSLGDDEVVDTQPSTVKTGAATGITRSTATLNGTADPEGESSTFYFEYGTTRHYGKTAPAGAPPGESVGTTTPGDQPVSELISGLTPGATYHYRLVEVNGKGSSYGLDRTFEVLPAVKDVTTDPVSELHRTDATLNSTMDPDGNTTHYYFEWGRTKRYGSTSAAPPGVELPISAPGDQHPSAVAAGLTPETTYHYRVVATDPIFGVTYGADRTFTTEPAVIGLDTDPASEIEPTSGVLEGHLDPDGIPTTYYFEWGKSHFYGHELPTAPGEDVGTTSAGNLSLSKKLAALEPGTTYHFRIAAVNSFGTTVGSDRSFTTPEAPSIEGVFSSDVTANSARLRARINPNGTEPSFETTYHFEYGTSIGYGNVVPVPNGTLSPGTSGQDVTLPISGLAETTYHFRLVAENDWGTVTSEDQTFDFKPPFCPNGSVRQQTGAAYLPDCRAYELVSPARAGGTALLAEGPSSPYASNQFAFTGFINIIPGTGEPPNGGTPFPVGDLYVASRTDKGWITHYVGIPGSETVYQSGDPESGLFGPAGILADETLSRFLTWKESAGYAPFLFDNEGNSLGRLPSDLSEVPGADVPPVEGGFIGATAPSGDFSHYAFSSRNFAFAPGGLTTVPGSAYDDDVATGAITLISKTATGGDIPQDSAAGGSSEYVRIPAVSKNGSHILMSTAAPSETSSSGNPIETSHLYMRVNDAVTYEVSEGEDLVNHGVSFVGMNENGTEVFFTTGAQMTADDHDTSIDLYRWSENGGAPTLTRLSVGNEASEGNTDSCSSEWIVKCGVEVVPTGRKEGLQESLPIDTAFARGGEAIYFYSPEELEGAHGVPGKRNLYVSRNGTVHHVATVNPLTPVERIDVSADGKKMAFVTKATLTAYENAGHSEMYTYDPESRAVLCVSCLPDGSPPTSDVHASQNGLFMTDDGRAFFSSADPLVARDADGITDVYEYVDGRVQLISSGTGNDPGEADRPIGLVGVSADGVNAFISTYETLVGQDENGPFLKFYDARVNGGFPFNEPAAACAAADECHGESSPPPNPPQIGTGAKLEGGNAVAAKEGMKQHRRRHHAKHRKRHRAKRHHHRSGR
jgi:hypothetical protein